MSSGFASALLSWYRDNGRDLPWRCSRDPYAIWISEVMLQQTRVEAVVPYFNRWMERFPDVEALARAEMQHLLAQWEGLGYYRRAHNLHLAAQRVLAEYGGKLPEDTKELETLPGIGRYSAAAIAAIAFDVDVIALDGNLRRVFSRLIDLELDPRTSQGERKLLEFAGKILPEGQAAAFNQALMDLGAMVCTASKPRCKRCPIAGHCLAWQRGMQEQRPVKRSRTDIPHYAVAAAVLRRDGSVLIGRRPEGGLLGGLWEFPGGKTEDGESLEACLRRELIEELGVNIEVGTEIGIYRHSYTHFRVTVTAFDCRLLDGKPRPLEHSEIRWVDMLALKDHPMGKVDRLIAQDLI